MIPARIRNPWVAFVLVALSQLAPQSLPAASLRRTPSVGDAGTTSAPAGLVVVLMPGDTSDRFVRAINNQYVSGVAVQANWRDLEPSPGQVDWSRLDSVFAAAQSAHKWVQLLVFPGFFAPDWAKQGTQTDQFPIQYGPGRGTVTSLSMPWDRTYLDRWFAFLKRVSERYGQSPAFKMIGAAGPTSVSAEFTLPNNPRDHKQWITDGYTPQKYMDAWSRTLEVYSQVFPSQYISLSAPGLPIRVQPAKNPGEKRTDRELLVQEAHRLLGKRLVLQWSNLQAGGGPTGGDEGPFVASFSGRITTGFQMKTSAQRNPEDMGGVSDPAAALRKCVDIGLQPNAGGAHIDYLEIYEPDVLAEDLQPVLKYAAERLARSDPDRRD